MRIAQSVVGYGNADRSWLGSALESQENNMGVTLDLSLFDTGTFGSSNPLNASEVRIPSGTNIGIVTATGKAGPYDSTASDGRQTSVGLLLNPVEGVNTSNANYRYDSQAVVRDGIVYTDKLPFSSGVGAVDSASKTALKLIDWRVRGTL